MTIPENQPPWERQLLEKLALATLQEQRLKRRWGIFFKLLGFAYLIAVLLLLVDWGAPEKLADGKHTAVVLVNGTIESGGEASAQNINEALRSASCS